MQKIPATSRTALLVLISTLIVLLYSSPGSAAVPAEVLKSLINHKLVISLQNNSTVEGTLQTISQITVDLQQASKIAKTIIISNIISIRWAPGSSSQLAKNAMEELIWSSMDGRAVVLKFRAGDIHWGKLENINLQKARLWLLTGRTVEVAKKDVVQLLSTVLDFSLVSPKPPSEPPKVPPEVKKEPQNTATLPPLRPKQRTNRAPTTTQVSMNPPTTHSSTQKEYEKKLAAWKERKAAVGNSWRSALLVGGATGVFWLLCGDELDWVRVVLVVGISLTGISALAALFQAGKVGQPPQPPSTSLRTIPQKQKSAQLPPPWTKTNQITLLKLQ